MKLSDMACKNAKPKDKTYKKFDGGGLYLAVNPNGSKLWRLKYRFLGKEKVMSFGPYPLITLTEARDRRNAAKKLLLCDPPKDPMTYRAENKYLAARNAENTFKAVALEWHEQNIERWSKNYASKVIKGLELHIFPYLGSRPIAEITPPELLNCLRKIEKRGSLDISGRTKQICGQVFRYGIQTGKCERDSSADLRGALKTRRTEHYKSLDIKQVPNFLIALERNEPRLFERTRRAVWLSLFTFVRPGEVRQARWEEIDFEEAQWAIPAHKMKMRRDHIVPLSQQALLVLQAQKKELYGMNTPWVFPSQVRLQDPMSDGTVNKAIKRLGYGNEMVAHGFRALARTTIAEKLGYSGEIIEKQLAHRTRNPLGEAYDRTQFMSQRIKMMQEWADYIETLMIQEKSAEKIVKVA